MTAESSETGERYASLPQPAEADLPRQVFGVSEVDYEAFSQARFKRWLGGLSLESSVEVQADDADMTDILESLREAGAGSAEKRRMVEANVMTAVVEALFKDRHVTRVEAEVRDDGEVVQFGQSMKSVHRNAFLARPDRPEPLQDITRAEALNGQRIEDAVRSGALDEYYFVVPSVVPAAASEDELGAKGDGYFLESMTYVVQATTRAESGKVITESAFMSGVEAGAYDDFETRMAKRHDLDALGRVYETFGLQAPRDAAELLRNGLYVHKSLMPNGVVDFMRWCDEATDSLLGRDIVREDGMYQAIIAESRRREASLIDVKDAIVKALLEEADSYRRPAEVTKRIWQLVHRYTVAAAVDNVHINPRVFGTEASASIWAARQTEDMMLRQRYMIEAHRTAVISGCGGGAGADVKAKGDSLNSDGVSQDADPDGEDEADDGSISLIGLVRCINARCRKLVAKREVIQEDCWKCPKCNLRVDICSGAVTGGDGGANPADDGETSPIAEYIATVGDELAAAAERRRQRHQAGQLAVTAAVA